jgi:hypothetical protein
MTEQEFNEKYKDYIEKGFDGLEFDIPEVTEYLDKIFEELTKIEGFKYVQIKLKFGYARFYCEPRTINTFEIEEKIDEIIKNLE